MHPPYPGRPVESCPVGATLNFKSELPYVVLLKESGLLRPSYRKENIDQTDVPTPIMDLAQTNALAIATIFKPSTNSTQMVTQNT